MSEGGTRNKTSTAEIAFVFDGSLEGLLSAIFVAYREGNENCDIVKAENLQPRLGQRIVEVDIDEAIALRVQRGIHLRCGPVVFEAVKGSSLSDEPETATIIYRFLRYALSLNKPHDCSLCHKKMKCGGLCTRDSKHSALTDISHPAVSPFIAINRRVYNEREKIMQFLRFEHLEGDLWFARCNPNASVIPLIMDWFAGRFNTQAFVIYDEAHHIAGVYEGHSWYLVKTDHVEVPAHEKDEGLYQQAWKRFYQTIAVESRYNPELRRSFMPKRLWRNITEMQESIPQTNVPEANARLPYHQNEE